MAEDKRHKRAHNEADNETKANMAGVEYSDEQRRQNEVASTAYTGSKNEKVDIQNDKLESGGF
ncbi:MULTISPECIES: hypothetical protein [Sporosarcina]|uniref:DUF4025 domain-containing protein n=1 Tax=Sporosarcina contaminans TaxID=633403 RepID=A0ABW3TZZ2_9BACL